ncbi:hypothetical protein H9X96_03130 [Pedobacter sp. N36a]|uniref:hypothetical protein n=1 Tax=Pedobacter sp. N36a TaxID=2767996 RepID=UPI0016569C40|nr:hypothetical protein [Pedobacter sp. N36a]MBC8984763.1 hypothetical protein [Pedobacter sp. N36a]
MQNNIRKIQNKATNALIQQLSGSNKNVLNQTLSGFVDSKTLDGYEETIHYLLNVYLVSDEESSFHVANTVHDVRMIVNLLRRFSDFNAVNKIRTEVNSCV